MLWQWRKPFRQQLTALTRLTNACMHCRDPSILSSITVCFTKPAHWSRLHNQVLHTCIQTYLHLHTLKTYTVFTDKYTLSFPLSAHREVVHWFILNTLCTRHAGLLKEYVLHVLDKSISAYKKNRNGVDWGALNSYVYLSWLEWIEQHAERKHCVNEGQRETGETDWCDNIDLMSMKLHFNLKSSTFTYTDNVILFLKCMLLHALNI